MKKNYDVIVFDLGNTLIRFDHRIAARKLSGRFGLDPKKIYDAFFDSEITRAFEKGEISPREFHRKAEALLGFKLPYREFVNIWNDIFWEDEHACDIARRLKKDYKVFLLSNVNRLHFEFITKKFDIMKIFDEIVASFAVGAMKPDRKIYDHVVKRAGCDKSKILYVDDREDLIKAARSLGIDSIKFEGAEKLREIMREIGILG
ncbi:MAG: HAD family phosphatase [Candidatus Omnitrophica bacterium]|nr:HAD family phosphatase [Candidatus Omnitrophota bacterium]